MKIVVTIIVVILIGLGIWKFTDSTNTPVNTPHTTPVADSRKYKDGTYSATGNYVSPNGPESVNVTLIIKNDIITSATFKGNGTNPTTMKMQALFSAGFSGYVVGKKLDEVSLTTVNGSSLTPKGFTDALSKIKLQARIP